MEALSQDSSIRGKISRRTSAEEHTHESEMSRQLNAQNKDPITKQLSLFATYDLGTVDSAEKRTVLFYD